MDAATTADDESAVEQPAEDQPTISACEGAPGRTVLLEEDNSDGWISTDMTVEPWR